MANINTNAATSASYHSLASNTANKQLNGANTQSTSNINKPNKAAKSTQTDSSQKIGDSFSQSLKKAQSKNLSNALSPTLLASNRVSNNLVQAGSNLAKQSYRDSTNAGDDASLSRLKHQLDSVNFKKNDESEANGTDLALKEIAVRFEQQFLGFMWNLAFRSDDRSYEGGIGEELFSSELIGELVKQASGGTDAAGAKVMGPIALDVYNDMKRSK